MSTVQVSPGVCGFVTTIIIQVDDAFQATCQITSGCQHIQALAKALPEMAVFQELRRPLPETTPYVLAGQNKLHAACPVPCAILKALEVAAGMALPADVHLSISKD